ncbi:MAG: ATP-binding protein [Clostridia bacterium]|nr:ATP-binding protein [Clostridia bacterium]
MLTRFSVENFKNFKKKTTFVLNQPYSYEYNQEAINANCVTKGIIYGINGSGKSNLALAIFDIILHLTDKEKLLQKYDIYLNLDSPKSSAEFEYVFQFGSFEFLYKYGKTRALELTYESLLVNGEEVVFYDFIKNEGFTNLKGAETLNLVSNRDGISRVKYIKSNAMLDKKDELNCAFYEFIDYIERMLMFYSLDERGYQGLIVGPDSFTQGIIRAGKTKEFEKFLYSQGIKYNLIEREVNGIKQLYCKFANGEYDFMSVASTGTKSLALFYYWYLRLANASFVYIDEYDAFYHFELSTAIIKLVKELKNTQVFFTTHNTDLLSNDLLRPDCFFIIKDNKINSFSDLTDKDLRKAHNIQKMYKAGSFNG